MATMPDLNDESSDEPTELADHHDGVGISR
jgi:hypothetical protein